MVVLNSRGKEKRPKFLLNFSLNELINIPQSVGSCYVKWHLKDGTGISGHKFNPLETDHTESSSSSSGSVSSNIFRSDGGHHGIGSGVDSRHILLSRSDALHRVGSASSNGSNNESIYPAMSPQRMGPPRTPIRSTHISSHSKGETPKVNIEQHKVIWCYNLAYPVQIKLHVDKFRNLSEKKLILKVLYENTSSGSPLIQSPTSRKRDSKAQNPGESAGHNPEDTVKNLKKMDTHPVHHESTFDELTGHHSKLVLGYVEINLADYVREDEMFITNRFLLTQSKVNSLLSLSIQLKLVRGSYQEFNIPHVNFGSGQFPDIFHTSISEILEDTVDIGSPTNSHFRNNILLPSQRLNSLQTQLSRSSNSSLIQRSGQVPPRNSYEGNRSRNPDTLRHSQLRKQWTRNVDYSSFAASNIKEEDSIIARLHEKSFQIPWDPRPNEFTISECIEDIIRGGDGWAKSEEGINLIDIQALLLTEDEIRYYGVTKKVEGDETQDLEKTDSNEPDNDFDLNNARISRKEFLVKQKVWTKRSQSLYSERNNTPSGLSKIPTLSDNARDKITWSVKPIT